MYLSDDIVYIEKPDGMRSISFVVDEFSGLFLHPSIFLLSIYDQHKYQWCFIRFFILIKF